LLALFGDKKISTTEDKCQQLYLRRNISILQYRQEAARKYPNIDDHELL